MRCVIRLLIPAAVWVFQTPVSAGGEREPIYGEGRRLADLSDKAITESSGLASGRANPDVLWTHNDSGGPPQLFAFGLDGKERAVVTVATAVNRDWEDMASFSYGGRHFLLIGDVGDNDAKREDYALYVVPEPLLGAGNRSKPISVAPVQTIRFRYEDGPHNCESVGIDPQTRTIYLVSKVPDNKCKIYALPWPGGGEKAPAVAKAIAVLDIPTTTAMDISPDGLRAVVLTYGDAYEFARDPQETWNRAFSRPPRRLRMPQRAIGESICYGTDGKTLYLSSECEGKDSRTPSPLLVVPVRNPDKAEPNRIPGN